MAGRQWCCRPGSPAGPSTGGVQPFAARSARTVSYDHAGLGFSDAGPFPRCAANINSDLRTALRSADISPPYILVGHSWGGVLMRRYANRHPQEVAGLILVDTVTEDFDTRLAGALGRAMAQERKDWRRLLRQAEAGTLTPRSDDYRSLTGLPRADLSPVINAAFHAMWTRPSYLRTLISESTGLCGLGAKPGGGELPGLGDLPLTVLSAGRIGESGFIGGDPALTAAWFAMHDDLTALSTRGRRITVDCGHNIPIEAPRAVVAAIEEMVEAVRAPLTLDVQRTGP